MVQNFKNISSEPTLREPNKTGLEAGSSSPRSQLCVIFGEAYACGPEEAVGSSREKAHDLGPGAEAALVRPELKGQRDKIKHP